MDLWNFGDGTPDVSRTRAPRTSIVQSASGPDLFVTVRLTVASKAARARPAIEHHGDEVMRQGLDSQLRGQTLVEFALIAPLLFLVVSGIITLGIGVFYQQQLANAAREAARYAAIHSATSQCPTRRLVHPNWSMARSTWVDNDCDPADLAGRT